jgi:hypothetical protein
MPTYRPPPGHEAPAVLLPLDFLERAEEFFEASQRVGQQGIFSWPRCFCICHAIELGLKAWLAFKGEDEARLRGYGHDLNDAMESAQRQGMTLSSNTVRAVNLLSPLHAELLPRYPLRTGEPIPTPGQFEPNVIEILEAACEAIRGDRSHRAWIRY